MSREEIDRILNADIDVQVAKKIQNIDQITDQLANKSNFLAQFQLLLQQELSSDRAQPLIKSNSKQHS